MNNKNWIKEMLIKEAAPELYQACEQSLAEFERHSPLECEGCKYAKTMLLQAVAKAKGENNERKS